jgi:hypothetical protein
MSASTTDLPLFVVDKTKPHWLMSVGFYENSERDMADFKSWLKLNSVSFLGEWRHGTDFLGKDFWEWVAYMPEHLIGKVHSIEDYLRAHRHLYKPGFSMAVIYDAADDPADLALQGVQRSLDRD